MRLTAFASQLAGQIIAHTAILIERLPRIAFADRRVTTFGSSIARDGQLFLGCLQDLRNVAD